MRTLHIRKFTVLSLFFILTMPWVFFVAAHLIETGTLSFGINKMQQKNITKMIQMIETNSKNWKNPAWQNKLRNQLQKTNMGVGILSESNQEIFRFTRDYSYRSTERFSVIQDGQLIGRVIIYLPDSNEVQMVATIVGLLLAFFIVGYEMRRFILKPLEKLSLAAREIAKGDFDVRLPTSPITEIAEVRDGFGIMVKGLQKSFQKQMEAEEERRFVFGAVAHDLRTPLFALRGYLDGLEQGLADTPEKMAKYVSVCKEISTQLDRLVEDLFTFTKTEYLRTELSKSKVDLSHILQKSIDSLSPLAREKHILIRKHFADNCVGIGDSHLLERAVTNLLDNAVRHTPFQGEIAVQCYKGDNKVSYTIQDTGAGFSSKELEHVFDLLYRGEESRNRSTGGAGLGLTISKKIMRRHGGDLTAGNHPDGGALLTGWIPMADNLPR